MWVPKLRGTVLQADCGKQPEMKQVNWRDITCLRDSKHLWLQEGKMSWDPGVFHVRFQDVLSLDHGSVKTTGIPKDKPIVNSGMWSQMIQMSVQGQCFCNAEPM